MRIGNGLSNGFFPHRAGIVRRTQASNGVIIFMNRPFNVCSNEPSSKAESRSLSLFTACATCLQGTGELELDRLPEVLHAAVNLFMPIISTFFEIVIRMLSGA